MTNDITDSELVSRYFSGDEVALEMLIKKHQKKLLTFIYYKVYDKSLANDIFQDTFIKIIVKLKERKYIEEGKFLPWAKRIAHNLVIDHFRKRSKNRFVSETTYQDENFSVLDIIKEPSENIEEQLVTTQIQEDIRSMIDYLPENQQEVVQLRFFLGLSFKEIAEHTNCSINTTLGRVRYALINLRKLMAENHIELTR
ncbi:MAG: RNA polymerase subunit sigma-24 [Flavobacteriales bacterium]|nr:MAG: RNA polymerase subunit sigma-24 [Flavobacteriales bacterium]